jgi:SAM-dependent methyltransferase
LATPKPVTADDLPARLLLFQLITGHYVSHAIYVAAKLGVPDLLAQGPRPSSELAEATGTQAPALNRVLRLLASAGVLAEGEDSRFALTPTGEYLRTDVPGSSRDTALLFAAPALRTWDGLLYSVQTGRSACEHVLGMDPFRYFAEHPEEAATFNRAMTAVSTQVAAAVAAAYDFSQFAKLVDVGGGHGVLLTTILKAYPAVRGVLFELSPVAEGAKKMVDAAGLASRCEVVGGDFFREISAGADAYIVKSVIHDWDDERAVTILRNCRRAIAPAGKLLLVEAVLPARVGRSLRDQIIVGSDVNMLVNTTGRERTDAEYRALVGAAGFRLTRILPLEGSLSSVLEAEIA